MCWIRSVGSFFVFPIKFEWMFSKIIKRSFLLFFNHIKLRIFCDFLYWIMRKFSPVSINFIPYDSPFEMRCIFRYCFGKLKYSILSSFLVLFRLIHLTVYFSTRMHTHTPIQPSIHPQRHVHMGMTWFSTFVNTHCARLFYYVSCSGSLIFVLSALKIPTFWYYFIHFTCTKHEAKEKSSE